MVVTIGAKLAESICGCLSDSEKPLVGQIQDAQSTVSQPASCPSPAVVDVSENVRSKLYAIFSKMGMFSSVLYLPRLKLTVFAITATYISI